MWVTARRSSTVSDSDWLLASAAVMLCGLWLWQHNLTSRVWLDMSSRNLSMLRERLLFCCPLDFRHILPFHYFHNISETVCSGLFFSTWDENQYERSRAHVKDHSLEYLIFSLQQHWCNYGNKFSRWTGMCLSPDKRLSYISPSLLCYTTTQEKLISAAPCDDGIIIFLYAQTI